MLKKAFFLHEVAPLSINFIEEPEDAEFLLRRAVRPVLHKVFNDTKCVYNREPELVYYNSTFKKSVCLTVAVHKPQTVVPARLSWEMSQIVRLDRCSFLS